MARIRSVHPGLFTDESFVSLSMTARVLFIGIWTEADDAGLFEWKPVTLKMRLFPADNIDILACVSELVSAGLIKQVTLGGKTYGAVRNFCRFQRPKKPACRVALTSEVREFVSAKSSDFPNGSELVHHDAPTGTGIGEQMEDGVGEGEGLGEGNSCSASSEKPRGDDGDVALPVEVGRRVAEIMGVEDNPNWLGSYSIAGAWIAAGYDPKLDIYPVVREVVERKRRSGEKLPTSLKYFTKAIEQAAETRGRIRKPEPVLETVTIRAGSPEFQAWVQHYRAKGQRTAFMDKSETWQVPTRWPPEHRQAAE